MGFGNCIFLLIIKPLFLLFEVVYDYANSFIGDPGLAIIALSLAMNLLVLPLYRRADAMQEQQRDIEAKLSRGVSHIRKTFKGDERTMMLQTYYRENNYSPLSALKGATSLLLEIPFFIAAYQFLSQLGMLIGVSLGPIADLSKPDGLLAVGGLAINLLPFIMTGVNVISSAIFTKGYPIKTKIQLYAMAAFFLVFLYDSPSGLVFYWTLNNLFSLVKTVFYKLKNPGKTLKIMAFAAGLAAVGFALVGIKSMGANRLALLLGGGVCLCLPMLLDLYGRKNKLPSLPMWDKENDRIFLLGGIFLALLVGLLIPSAVVGASPQEFVNIFHFYNPLWYVVSATLISVGAFVLWLGVFYWLVPEKTKVIFTQLIWIICGVALVNYMFFGTGVGNISTELQYDMGVTYEGRQIILNLAVTVVIAVIFFILIRKKKKLVLNAMTVGVAALLCMSAINLFGINNDY